MRRDPDRGAAGKSLRLAREAARPSLLYVEDDDDNWEVAELRIGRAYALTRAANDEQACRILRERHASLAAILMDIELRGSELNGVELTELFRGNTLAGRALPAYARDLPTFSKPVIYVTAHGVRYTDVQLMLTGADRVVTKPVDFGTLTAVLEELTQTNSSG
ncbi:MAG: response regulator [Polyangiales bacterium]